VRFEQSFEPSGQCRLSNDAQSGCDYG